MAYTRVKDRTSINNSLSTNDFKFSVYVPVKDRINIEPTYKEKPTLDFSIPPSGTMTTTPSFIPPSNIESPFKDKPTTEIFGESFRSGVLQTGSAIETILSIGAKKIGAEQLSKKLETISEIDKDLSRANVEVIDSRQFSDKIKDPKYIASGIAQNLPNLLFGMGVALPAAVAGAPAIVVGGLAFAGAATLEGGFAYQDAKEFGASDETSEKTAALVGVANGLLEALPITKLLTRSPVGKQIKRSIIRQITSRIFKQTLLESGTESMQEIVLNSVATVYDENRDILQGVPESAFFGGLLGGGTSLVTDTFTNEEIKQKFGEAKQSQEGFAKVPYIKVKDRGLAQEPLAQEAKKFKTAEEFIASLDEGKRGIFVEHTPLKRLTTDIPENTPISNFIDDKEITIYRGIDVPLGKVKKEIVDGDFVTTSRQLAETYAMPENVVEKRVKAKDVYIDKTEFIPEDFAKGIEDLHIEAVYNTNKPLTKQQLTDIFNKAKGKTFVSDIGKDIETKLKAKAPIIKERIKAEKKITKIKTTAREARDKIVNSIKNKVGTTQAIREDIVNYAKENLDLHEKGKLLATVKNAKTFKDLDKAKLYIEKLSEEATKRMLLGKIHKEIKVIKVSGKKPKGKYTPEIQNTLNAIKKLTDLNQKNANLKLEENLKNNPIKVPQEIVMENYLLSLYTGSVKQKQELLSIIRQLKEKGEMASALKKFNIQADIQAKSDLVVDRVTGGEGIEAGRLNGEPVDKTKIQAVKQYLKAIGKKTILDWRGLMTTLDFNSSVKTKPLADFFSVSKNESKYKELQSKYKEEFDIAFSSIYDIKNKPDSILKKINSIATEKVKVDKYEMTRDELIKRYMEVQDPTLRDSFIEGNKYTEKTLDAIDNKISEQDKKLAEWQLKYYGEMYNKVNEVYRVMNGVDLPFNEFYSPIKRVGYTVEPGHTEFLDEAFYRVGVTNKSLISRVKNLKPISKQGSISVLDRHLTDTNYYIAWAEKIRELDSIFTNNKVMESIKQEFPTNILESITNKIQHISTHGNKTASRIGWVDYIRKNFVIGNLAVKPTLTIKQLVSTLAYLEKINSVSLISGTLDFIKNPVKNYKTLQKESSFIKTRGSGMERDIQDALKEGVFSRYNKKQNLANTLILNVKLGDKGAIVLGSWSLRKQRLKEGITLENIINEYEEFGAETQQSADISRLSEIQLGGSIEKLFTVFKSSQRAYLQKELNAVKSMFRKDGFGKENVKKVAKTLFIYHVLLPVVFQWIANMGGWDEEDRKEYKRAALLGSFNGLFIAGDIIDGIIRQVMGMRVWDTEVIIADIGDDIRRIISNLTEDDVSTEDFQTALDAMASAGTGVSGLPIEYSYDILESLYKGNYETSLKQTLGWSEYVIGEPKKGDSKLKQFEDRIKKIEGSNKLKDFEARIKKIQTR